MDEFLYTCESNIIELDSFDIATEGLDNVKTFLANTINRARDLADRFIAWIKKFFTDIELNLSIKSFEKRVREKCEHKIKDKDTIYTYIQNIDQKVVELAFPGKREIDELQDFINVTNFCDKVTQFVDILGNRVTNVDDTILMSDNIFKTFDSRLSAVQNSLKNGFQSNDKELKALEDKNDDLKDKKSQLYPLSISKFINSYKVMLTILMSRYSLIKSELNKMQNDIRQMNSYLNAYKNGAMPSNSQQKVSKCISGISATVNRTMASRQLFLSTVIHSNIRCLNSIDRLTYGQDPYSEEAAPEYKIPDYNEACKSCERLKRESTLPISAINIGELNVKYVHVTILIAKSVSSPCCQLVKPNTAEIYLNTGLFDNKDEKAYKFAVYHELGHIRNNDYSNSIRSLKYQLLGRQDDIETRSDLYAAKSAHLSKNEYEKEMKGIHDIAENEYTRAGLNKIDKKLNHKLLNGREKEVERRFNKDT